MERDDDGWNASFLDVNSPGVVVCWFLSESSATTTFRTVAHAAKNKRDSFFVLFLISRDGKGLRFEVWARDCACRCLGTTC